MVRDLDAAIAWYRQTFKLIQGDLFDIDEGDALLQSRSGKFKVALGRPSSVPVDRAMLATRNAQKAREWLMGRGVNVDPIQTDRQGRRYFEIRDLENNVIEVFEELPETKYVLNYLPMGLLQLSICSVIVIGALFAADSKPRGDDRIYKIGSDVTAPKPILTPHPEAQQLPEKKPGHKNKHTRGVVVLSGYVGKDGKFHGLAVVRSPNPALDSVALKTVEQWRFHPCTRKGVPVNCATALEISFDLY